MTAGSAAKLDLCTDLGADITIDYRDEDFVERMRDGERAGADVILDIVGARTWTATSRRSPTVAGRSSSAPGRSQGRAQRRRVAQEAAGVIATALRARPNEVRGKSAVIAAGGRPTSGR